MTMWEILSLAKQRPFADLTDRQVLENHSHFYSGHGRQTCPLQPGPSCPREIYDLMRECWNRDEASRPTFREIHMFLQRKNMGYNPQQEEARLHAASSVFVWSEDSHLVFHSQGLYIIISVRNKIIIGLISEHCNTCQLFCFVNGLYILISAFVELVSLQTHNQQQEQHYCAWAVREWNDLLLILHGKTQHQTWSTSSIEEWFSTMTVECDCMFMPFYHWLWYIGHNWDYTV